MSDYKVAYGAVVTLACALDGLPTSDAIIAARSDPIVNTGGVQDFEFHLKLVGSTEELINRACAQVFLYTSGDDGATYSHGAITSGRVTLHGWEQAVARVPIFAGAAQPFGFRLSGISRIGSYLPPRNFGLLICQNSGQALGTGCVLTYRAISTQLI